MGRRTETDPRLAPDRDLCGPQARLRAAWRAAVENVRHEPLSSRLFLHQWRAPCTHVLTDGAWHPIRKVHQFETALLYREFERPVLPFFLFSLLRL
jgi:hypothetical protein